MVSISILGLIAVATVLDLRSSRQKDQLNTAVRVVASDLRSLQDRGLTAQNILTCPEAATGKNIVCEASTASCVPSTCTALPPYGVGAHFVRGATTYDLFSDVDASKNDWKKTDATEIFQTRDLSLAGAPDVVIDDLVTSASVASIDVAFQRQNGAMGIDACYTPCTAPVSLRIVLRHIVSNETKEVDLNSYTGRISVP